MKMRNGTRVDERKDRLSWTVPPAAGGSTVGVAVMGGGQVIDRLGWRSARAHVGRIAQSPPSHTLSSSIAPSLPSPSSSRPIARSHNSAEVYLSAMSDSMGRRRSVDVGGLALALSDENQGHGWGGWEETDCGETRCVACCHLRRASVPTRPIFPLDMQKS